MKKLLSVTLAALLLLGLLAACGNTAAPASGTDAAPAATQAPAPAAEASAEPAASAETEAPAHPETETKSDSKVASAEDMTTVEEVTEEGMVPVYAESLVPGTYPVEMKSSSSMFKADHCELTVGENGEMTVTLYMTSEAYPWMYAGTAEQAAAAEESALIPLSEDHSFTLPLKALDEGESFAAFSKRKELWYDRTLLFRVDSLPVSAFAEGFFTTAASLGLADGDYTCGVTLAGGSGKASVVSPLLLTVAEGNSTALLVWNSSKFDYMVVDGEKYLPTSVTEDQTTFEIPVSHFDRPVTVHADTTAMSQPHEIEYTLTLDSASLEAAAQ